MNLKHFKRSEFTRPASYSGHEVDWFGRIALELLVKLDSFREELGTRVIISPAPGAVGRHLGDGSTSKHNVDHWGKVLAVDVMLPDEDNTPENRKRVFEIAKRCGFHGIGVYPKWAPSWGLHLDVRADREDGDPASWSGWPAKRKGGKQQYLAVDLAFDKVDPA